MNKQKEDKIVEVVNTIYMMATIQLQKPVLEAWKEDLENKSIEQIDHAFRKYRKEWYGKPNLALFINLTLSYEPEIKLEEEKKSNKPALTKEQKLANIKKLKKITRELSKKMEF